MGTQEEGLALLQALGQRCGEEEGKGRRKLRAGPRPLPQAFSDSHRHPGHQWRSPGRR